MVHLNADVLSCTLLELNMVLYSFNPISEWQR